MPTSFFAIRVKSHVGWTPETEVKFKGVWPIGSWVGSEESDWGPRWHVTTTVYIGDADLYSTKKEGQASMKNLTGMYGHVGFELVEFKEQVP